MRLGYNASGGLTSRDIAKMLRMSLIHNHFLRTKLKEENTPEISFGLLYIQIEDYTGSVQ